MTSAGGTGRWIHVVDDDPAVRDALSLLLRSKGYEVRTFASGRAILDAFHDLEPGCVVLDVRMPETDGLAVQLELIHTRPDLAIILMTGDGDIPLAVRALKAGAVDFIEKPFEPEVLLQSIALGFATFRSTPDVDEALTRMRTLTVREKQVLDHLVAGETSKEIARIFQGSPRTVEIHRARILAKLGARNVAEAVRIAMIINPR